MTGPRIVLDTNVVVSAALDTRKQLVPSGRPSLCVLLGLAGMASIVASRPLLSEYAGVLRRSRFGLPREQVTSFLTLLRSRAILVRPALVPVDVLGDADDALVLATAHGGRAAYLVTGNQRHFPAIYGVTRIVSPAQFLDILFEGPTTPREA